MFDDFYVHNTSEIPLKHKLGSHITVMVPAVPAVVSKAEYDYGTCGTAGRVQPCLRYRRQSSTLPAVPPVRRFRTVTERESHESLLKWSSS